MTSAIQLTMASVLPDPPPSAVERALAVADYLATGTDALRVRQVTAADHTDPAPGTLFTDPAWLRAYGMADLLVVEPAAGAEAPRLVFARERDHLVHCGRLLSLEPDLIETLSAHLLRRPGVAFMVFEDVDVAGPIARSLNRTIFRYQNNWRVVLDGPDQTRISRQTAQGTGRKTRNLLRDNPGARLDFEPAPGRAFLRAIVDLGRARIESQGKRYGIDAAEFERLAIVAEAIGHGSVIRDGERVISGDLICIAGHRAYFLNGGYDPAYGRYSPGMGTLLHAIETCRARGLIDFNLMWGDLPYKQRLGARRVPLVTIVVRRSSAALLRPSHLAALCRFGWPHLKRILKPWVRRGPRQSAPGEEG